MLKLYNDLIKDKQDFVPIEKNKVSIYVCGPTVYDSPHIGHARAAVAFDILRRYLLYKGFHVTYVSNYTDVDDKMINRANENKIPIGDLAQKYIDEYEKVMLDLNVLHPDITPRATGSIEEIQDLIKLIMKNGYAYESNGSVYYEVDKYEPYDTLFMRKKIKDKTETGLYQFYFGGAEQDTQCEKNFVSDKRADKDFALWKKTKPNEPKWNSPWGEGRPGWHIECSAMSYKHLGKEIDIHGGGKDLIFPHHTNEIAQTDAAVGTKLARYWVHNGFVNINNEKMSKSLKNFFTAEDVIKEFGGMGLRYFLTSVNYRRPINYTVDALKESKESYEKIKEFYETVKPLSTKDMAPEDKQKLLDEITKIHEDFIKALDDDLNSVDALTQLFKLIKLINGFIFEDKKEIDDETKKAILDFMMDFSNIFGIILDKSSQQLGVYGKAQTDQMDELIQAKQELISKLMDTIIGVRNDLRKQKLWDISDKIRDELKKMGIELNDMKGKTFWKINED